MYGMLNSSLLIKVVMGVIVAGAVVTGTVFVVKEHSLQTLTRSLEDNLNSGDYVAAIAAAGKIKEEGKGGEELEETIRKTARLIVAEEAYKKAKQAAEKEHWADARSLLSGSEALTDTNFAYYGEAKEIYEKAEALLAKEAHKTAVTIQTLEDKAKAEQVKRKDLEEQGKKLQSDITEREKLLTESKAETAEAKKQAEEKQTALVAEQARTKDLAVQVEKESRQKFFNELRVYRDMAEKGRQQLDAALSEISGKRDVTALIYISQGKVLFEEARSKVLDMKANRTPAAFAGNVNELVSALDNFLEAGKQLRNSVVYIDDQGGAEFTSATTKAKAALAGGATSLASVSSFIAGN